MATERPPSGVAPRTRRLGRLERPALAGVLVREVINFCVVLALDDVLVDRPADASTCSRSASASGRWSRRSAGYDYVEFVATGTVATAVLFSSVFPAMFGTFVKYKFQRTYDAILAAPVDTEELVTAEALWIAARAGVVRLRADRSSAMVFGLDPTLGHAHDPVHRLPRGASAGRRFGILIAAVLKSIDNFSYVTSTVHHAAVPRRRHVLPAQRPAGVGAGRLEREPAVPLRRARAPRRRSASRAGSTSATSRSSWPSRSSTWRLAIRLHGAPAHRLSRRARRYPQGLMPSSAGHRAGARCSWSSSRRSRSATCSSRAGAWPSAGTPTSRRPASSSSTSAT